MVYALESYCRSYNKDLLIATGIDIALIHMQHLRLQAAPHVPCVP